MPLSGAGTQARRESRLGCHLHARCRSLVLRGERRVADRPQHIVSWGVGQDVSTRTAHDNVISRVAGQKVAHRRAEQAI